MSAAPSPAAPAGRAAQRWRAELAGWAVPDEILAAATSSPWGHPVKRFAARADADIAEPSGASFARAREALSEVRGLTGSPGSLLDVGAGAGAASLPLAPWTGTLTALDPSQDMLDAFARRADAVRQRYDGHLAVRVLNGRWPEAAAEAGVHDVVVCHHVVYDVGDIAPFVAALTAAARHRVVLELTPEHPMAWLAPLWLQFHGLVRPTRPTSDDLVAVLHEAGVRALTVERWVRTDVDGLTDDERDELATRRLCLPPERKPEVKAALDALPPRLRRRVVTLTWAPP